MKLFGQRYPEEIAKRVPPGQRLVKGWPVLHYGPIPTFDEATWDLEVSGAVESPYTLTYGELKGLGPADVQADMHCVTGWSTLDNEWTGIPFRVLVEKATPKPEAKWVIAHCDYGSGRRRPGGLGSQRRGARARARVSTPPGRSQALRVEEREVAAGP